MAKTQIKEQKDVPQTQDPTDPGVAYGEPVRIGLATGSRADNTLPERNAPSREEGETRAEAALGNGRRERTTGRLAA
jgi:hypothetical protein